MHMKSFSFFSILLIISSCAKQEDKILPKQKSLIEAVYASVTIQPDSLYQVYAIVGGILDRNLVEEGAIISKNDELFQMINNTPKLNAQNAKFTLDLARENYKGSATILGSIEEEIAAATLKYKNDSVNYFRQKNLWEQQIGSKVDYDTKKLNYELASNTLEILRSKYKRTQNELFTIVKQAENRYSSSLITTKDFTVKSKINGKVYAIYKEPGEIINTLEPLASIGSASNFVIEMLVDEVDIVRLFLGQKVIINLDAYTGEIFTGNISKIYPQKDERNQTFKVEAVFKNPPKVLYPGLSGEASIIIAQKDTVLTIPKSYIIENTKVITDDGLITITIGLQNMNDVEVVSGISKDTYIYKPTQ